MKKNIKSILIVLVFFILLFSFLYINQNNKKIILNEKEFIVSVADTQAKQTKGLSFKKRMKESRGMLFVFDEMKQNNFWMKDMYFPLDIIFFDENKKVVYVVSNVTPESYPETFGGEVLSKYVLEINASLAEKYNIKIGDEFYFKN